MDIHIRLNLDLNSSVLDQQDFDSIRNLDLGFDLGFHRNSAYSTNWTRFYGQKTDSWMDSLHTLDNYFPALAVVGKVDWTVDIHPAWIDLGILHSLFLALDHYFFSFLTYSPHFLHFLTLH